MRYLLGLSGEPLDRIPDPRLQGVGMIRSEYLCRLREEYVTISSCRDFIAQYVSNVCRVFAPYEVWYRTTELVTPEVNVLAGNDKVIEEKHYALGLRGVRRGVLFRETLRLELSNIAGIAEQYANLNVLFPYVADPRELEICLELLDDVGFRGRYGIMAEIPSAILLLDDFIDLGISTVVIGINDLTALTLGTYRGSTYHDPRHPAVVKLVKQVIDTGRRRDVAVSLGGYMTSRLHVVCQEVGLDRLIVHYSDLPEVLGIPGTTLPHLGLLSGIKKLTKCRIAEMEERKWKERLGI